MFPIKPDIHPSPLITHAQLYRVIVAAEESPPNADIEYQLGFLGAGGVFQRAGVDHIHLQDKDAVTEEREDPDNPGQTITVEIAPAVTDYTDFIAAVNASVDVKATAVEYLVSKIGA